jgi:hypothetical protein
MLLDHGVEVNTEGIGIYGNPPQAARFAGNDKVVRILLENGANVNICGTLYHLKLLIDKGADINAKRQRRQYRLNRSSRVDGCRLCRTSPK